MQTADTSRWCVGRQNCHKNRLVTQAWRRVAYDFDRNAATLRIDLPCKLKLLVVTTSRNALPASISGARPRCGSAISCATSLSASAVRRPYTFRVGASKTGVRQRVSRSGKFLPSLRPMLRIDRIMMMIELQSSARQRNNTKRPAGSTGDYGQGPMQQLRTLPRFTPQCQQFRSASPCIVRIIEKLASRHDGEAGGGRPR